MKTQIDWQETVEDIRNRADKLLTRYVCSSSVPRDIRFLMLEAMELGYRPWIESSRSKEFPLVLEKTVSGCDIKIDVCDLWRGTIMLSPRINMKFRGREMEVTVHMCEFNSIKLLEDFVVSLQGGLVPNEED